MTSKNNSKNAGQKQDLIRRTFRLTPDNEALLIAKGTQHDMPRAELLRYCLDFCEANGEAFDAFITGSTNSSDVEPNAKAHDLDTEQSESTDSVDADSSDVDDSTDASDTDSADAVESTNSAVIEPGTPLIGNKHLNSLVLDELKTSTRNLERFAHTAQQNRLSSVALQSMEISNRLKHIRDVLANE